MSTIASPLLSNWELLQERVMPRLLGVEGRPRVWAVGSIADAMVITAAYRQAGDGRRRIDAYVTTDSEPPHPVSFSLRDIRCMPRESRTEAFRRESARGGWVLEQDLAEQVILATPSEPVDLVTLRVSEAPDRMDAAVDRLNRGGYLLLVGEGPDVTPPRSVKPVGPGGRMFCKRTARKSAPAAPPSEEIPETLAVYLAREELVLSHTGLARSLARRFSHHGESKDDLEQVALLALVKAAQRFDPSREISFSTFATASVLGEIKRHFRDKTWMMRVPRSVQEVYLAVKEARDSLTHELSASPTIQQIAARIGVTDEAVLEAMEAGENYWPESLDVGVFEGETGRDVPVQEAGFELSLERQQLATLLPRLEGRERLILRRIYFDGWTQRQVAEEVGVSQMQVSRLLNKTIEKIRTWTAA